MIQDIKVHKKIKIPIQLLTWSCLKRVKTYDIVVESIEASACVLTLRQVFNPTSHDFRVEGVYEMDCSC